MFVFTNFWPSAGQSHETHDLYEIHGDMMKTRSWDLGDNGRTSSPLRHNSQKRFSSNSTHFELSVEKLTVEKFCLFFEDTMLNIFDNQQILLIFVRMRCENWLRICSHIGPFVVEVWSIFMRIQCKIFREFNEKMCHPAWLINVSVRAANY